MTRSPTGIWQSERFRQWLNRRLPPANSVELHQGNVFILPTREGIYFMVLVVLMVIAAINYQNSLIFLIAFLLFSLFMVSILHTFRNLSGLLLQAGSSRPAFAGEDAEFDVVVSRDGDRQYEGLRLGWDMEMLAGVDLIEVREARVRLFVPTAARGRFNPGRLLVETNYPVGLFRAWSWIDLDMSAIVYPRPLFAGDIPDAYTSSADGEAVKRDGVDDFYGLRDFSAGDSIRHVAWKSYARTEDMQVKEFAALVDRRVWLDWSSLDGLDRESRLSRLCYWVLQLSATTDDYGLRLPGIVIEPGSGGDHRERVLRELALFEVVDS